MTEFLQRDFAHQSFFDLCIHEKQRLRQALNPLSNLLLTKIQLCWDRPNITGSFGNFRTSGPSYIGCFFASSDSSQRHGSDGVSFSGAGFDASRSSSTYGMSSVVQPSALHLLSCIKT